MAELNNTLTTTSSYNIHLTLPHDLNRRNAEASLVIYCTVQLRVCGNITKKQHISQLLKRGKHFLNKNTIIKRAFASTASRFPVRIELHFQWSDIIDVP